CVNSASATHVLACAVATISGRASASRSAVARLIGKRKSLGPTGAGLRCTCTDKGDGGIWCGAALAGARGAGKAGGRSAGVVREEAADVSDGTGVAEFCRFKRTKRSTSGDTDDGSVGAGGVVVVSAARTVSAPPQRRIATAHGLQTPTLMMSP